MSAKFSVALALQGRRCVVVGGGAVAERKLEALLAGGADDVVVVAPVIAPGIEENAREHGLEVRRRAFTPTDLDGAFLVMIGTDDRRENAAITNEARARGVLVNAADDPAHCDFILPAVVRRGDVQVAVTTAGRSPALSRHLKERIDRWLPGEYGPLLDISERLRNELRREGQPADPARWQEAINEEALEALHAGEPDRAEQLMRRALGGDRSPPPQRFPVEGEGTGPPKPSSSTGEGTGPEFPPGGKDRVGGTRHSALSPRRGGRIVLVGAGPGDPGLITVAGRQALTEADIIVYDRLVSPDLLEIARADARRIYAGKEPGGGGPLNQEQINALLCAEANAGQVVVRLKGGDPFVFGRGGEEALAAARAGIPCTVIPGVTAAIAAPAAAGIAVTHRGLASAFTVVTGHREADGDGVDWDALARLGGTLVLLMGAENLPTIVDRLSRAGMALDTPAAIVEAATTPEQRVVVGTLADLPDRAQAAGIRAPATTVIGPVVTLANEPGEAAARL